MDTSTLRLDAVHDGRGYSSMTVDELVAAGVPQAVIDAALAKHRAGLIKGECKRRIYVLASAESQMNMTAAATSVAAKSAGSRSQAEKDMLDAYDMALDWVKVMRERVVEIAADPAIDFTADASWPQPAAEAVALVAQF